MTDNNIIGKNFKRLLKVRKLSYAKFASRIGLASKQHVFYMLNKDDRDWKHWELDLWCKVLGVEKDKVCSHK